MLKDKIYRSIIALVFLGFGSFYSFYQKTKLGLDLEGGVAILLEASPIEGKVDAASMERLSEIIDRRINAIGVAEPIIQTVGDNKLSIEIPGLNEIEEAIELIGKTALLEFKIEKEDGTLEEAVLTGKDLVKAEVIADSGLPSVKIEFSKNAAKVFYNLTKNNIGKSLAIVLDDEVQSSPKINVPIPNGIAQITGNFDYESARKLALLLNAGALPVKVDVLETRIVSATLGQEALDNSLQAGFWAIIFIVCFMAIWYFLPGILASISLAIFGLLSLGVLNFIGATLTLPGIAGFILSLGMAVDANVIIFEVIKEELQRGLSVASAIKSGFNRSLTSIIDSNVTTLIVTAILFSLGTGPIKGYAITLSIGVVASMFSAIFITKLLIELIFDSLNINSKRSFGIFDFNFNLDVIKRSSLLFGLSIVALLFSGHFLITKGLNYGVDFTGGNLISMKIDDERNFAEVVRSFDDRAQVQFSENSRAIIKTSEMSLEKREDFYSHLRRNYGSFTIESEESIGAVVGTSLKRNAILALALGSLLMILYISLRFKLAFALAAIAALLHDIIIAMGVISFLGYEVNSTFIVALLTILGYSINDTVVVFDRIRENIRKSSSLKDNINKSINQVFIRSFNTSFTTFLSVLALLMFGSDSLQTFLVTFLVGIVAGTYSSIFLASPLVYFFSKGS